MPLLAWRRDTVGHGNSMERLEGYASSPRSLWRSLGDEFGLPKLCQDDCETLEHEARLITAQFVQPALDIGTYPQLGWPSQLQAILAQILETTVDLAVPRALSQRNLV